MKPCSSRARHPQAFRCRGSGGRIIDARFQRSGPLFPTSLINQVVRPLMLLGGARHGIVGAAVARKSKRHRTVAPREQSRSWSEGECAIATEPHLHTSVVNRHHGADMCRSRDRRIYSVERSGQDRRDGRLRQSKRAREFQRFWNYLFGKSALTGIGLVGAIG
jgi:hypothetical protein